MGQAASDLNSSSGVWFKQKGSFQSLPSPVSDESSQNKVIHDMLRLPPLTNYYSKFIIVGVLFGRVIGSVMMQRHENAIEAAIQNTVEENQSGVFDEVAFALQCHMKMDEFENELSKIVGLTDLKIQLRKWAKGRLLDQKHRAEGIDIGPMKMPHMAFLGSPGTGKTTVARTLGK